MPEINLYGLWREAGGRCTRTPGHCPGRGRANVQISAGAGLQTFIWLSGIETVFYGEGDVGNECKDKP